MFGIPLTESLGYARSRISYIDEVTGNTCNGFIPVIIAKCGAFLKDEGFFFLNYFIFNLNVTRNILTLLI